MITNRYILLLLLLLIVFCTFSSGEAANFPVVNEQVQGGMEEHLSELEFKEARVKDAIRIIAELTQVNILATAEAGNRVVTLFIRNLTVGDAIDSICRVAGLWYRFNKKTKVYVVMTTEEYFKDIIVFREEETKFFTLKYQNVVKVGRLLEAMFGEERVVLDLQNDFKDDLSLPGASLNTGSGNVTSRSSSNNRRGDNKYRRSRGRLSFGLDSDGNVKQELSAITTGQIELLEQKNSQDSPLLLSEKTLSSVRKRSRVPIFVSVNREHNLLFVRTADEKAMEEIEKIVKDSDRPTPQVLLEMKVMSIRLQDGFQSAFDFSYMGGVSRKGPADGQPPNPYQSGDTTSPEAVLGFMGSLTNSGSMVFQLLNDNIRARINILKTEGRVNVLATPMLLATNNRAAKIFIGERRPIIEGYHAGGRWNSVLVTDIQQTEIGNTLLILPSINSDRTVMMRLLQERSEVVKGGATIPIAGYGNQVVDIVRKSTLEGIAMARDGLTVMVGGMITESTNDSEEKVPLLGDIPLLGALFTKTVKKKEKDELILLITPHVFTTPAQAEAVTRQRLGALTNHGDSINIYLDKLDKTRLETGPGRKIMRSIAEASTPLTQDGSEGHKQGFITMTRVAARQVRLPLAQRQEENGVRPVSLDVLPYALPLFTEKSVETIPVAGWFDGIRYITAFMTRNLGNEPLSLDIDSIHGNWQAATIEMADLAPAGMENDVTYLYLISNKSLDKVILGRTD